VTLAGGAHLVEIFSSVQGEGPHVGTSTLFVRFGECDLRCRWCDTPHSWKRGATCRIETRRGSAVFRTVSNPVALDEVMAASEALALPRHRFVSLTGGEPLLQPEAVEALSERFRAAGPRVHLETHGLHAEALARVVGAVDVVSMDWKLASDVWRASESGPDPSRSFHAEHVEFLRVALRAPEVVVKVVVTEATRDTEIDEMARAVAGVSRDVTLIVQPVTPTGGSPAAVGSSRLLALAARLEAELSDVRVIPQTHPLLGAL
jgi:organic radical activating enzyme